MTEVFRAKALAALRVSLFNRPLLAPFAERREGGMGASSAIKRSMFLRIFECDWRFYSFLILHIYRLIQNRLIAYWL